MQLQAGSRFARAASVDVIADDRPPHGGAMHAQLMRAAGERLEHKPADANGLGLAGSRIAGPASHHLPRGDRRLTSGIVLHPPAACRVLAAERQLAAALVLCRPARDHPPIAFFDAAALEPRASCRQPLPGPPRPTAPRLIPTHPISM